MRRHHHRHVRLDGTSRPVAGPHAATCAVAILHHSPILAHASVRHLSTRSPR